MTLAAEPPHMMSVTFPNNATAAAVAAAAAMAAAQHNNGVFHQIVFTILEFRTNYLIQLMRTTNFTKHEFLFIYLLSIFYQIKLQNINNYIGIFWCILILIQNFYLVKYIQKINKQKRTLEYYIIDGPQCSV